ncbi:MAG TPA: hypothetical protein VGG04_14590 [Candidatus Sulfotelmatobacter sp.]|jgi:hypothetical protein
MLQAHSFLWHYGWVAPNLLTLALAALLFSKGLHKRFAAFFIYLVFVSVEELALYTLDIWPTTSAITWWRAFWIGTIVEGLLKFVVIAELMQTLLHPWPSVARVVRNLVAGAGCFFVFVAAFAAAWAAPDNVHWLVGGGHVLSQTLYLTQAGLIISIFIFAMLFRIPWQRYALGIAVGLGVVWCGHLAIWALISGGVVRNRGWEDLANMATYHVAVLIWYYYLLIPEKSPSNQSKDQGKPAERRPSDPLSGFSDNSPEGQEEVLENWNRELERLIHQ